MKGIVVAALVVCISGCATQAEKPLSNELAVTDNSETSQPKDRANTRPSEKVFKDDYARLLVKSPPGKRKTIVLGRKNK